MAIDIQKLFNEELPARLAKYPDAAHQIGAVYQINIGSVGEWHIDLKSSPPRVFAGNVDGADCTVTIAAEDFQKLMENPQANGMQLFFAGKLKVTGNNMLAMKLPGLFTLGAD